MATIECGGFIFYSNFDSGNLQRVEWVPRHESAAVSVTKNGKESAELPDVEFNLWTKPDCLGTEYENGNRTWFYFGIKGYLPLVLVKLNLVDLNRQAKMYSQGMAPVVRMVPGKPNWDRVRDKVTYSLVDNIFTLTFKYRTPDNCDTITYFAFTYPYTYTELQTHLESVDSKLLSVRSNTPMWDDIYYVRECLTKSIENRRIDLITISSYYNISTEREVRLKLLFPETDVPRPFKFKNKKVIFISARVHPGETPSSFVFNGFLNLILTRDDPVAIILRRMYIFKLIPFLNPDGVYKGHYRTDTRGVNLNRVYLNPSFRDHPSVYAARALIRYYHFGYEKEDIIDHDSLINMLDFKSSGSSMGADNNMTEQVQDLSLNEKEVLKGSKYDDWCNKWKGMCHCCGVGLTPENSEVSCILKHSVPNDVQLCYECTAAQGDSGLYMYIDMHGHASKKGIFMYGNHFEDVEKSVECMLLSKVMSLNNHNFHFTACNFTERNMYLKDRRDGMSREGSGRVAVLKITGLVKSYTLECNYNTGRLVNVLPPTVKENNKNNMHTLPLPPKYTPAVFEEVGRAIGASILDLTGHNPLTRIPNSEFHSLNGLQEWLRVNVLADIGISRMSARKSMPNNNNQNKNRPKSLKTTGHKIRTLTKHTTTMKCKPVVRAISVPADRKENIVYTKENMTNQSTSTTPLNKNFTRTTSSKSKCLSIRGKVKRDNSKTKQRPYTQDGSQPHKSSLTPIKLKSEAQVNKNESPKRLKISSSYHRAELTNDRFKLKEICFVKQNITKKLVAKFNKDTEYDDNEDIVVAWDTESCSPRVLGVTELPENSAKCSFKVSEASTSSKVPSRGSALIKSSSFMSNKVKRTKTKSLRRLASASIESTTNKVDKINKKRKKLKAKII